MPTLVQFGAGAVGRGFIAPTFAAAGWTIRFIDISAELVSAINRRGSYLVIEADGSSENRRRVEGVSAVALGDGPAVADAIASADLLATAVGVANLPALAGAIAPGICQRQGRRDGPIDILICENGLDAASLLRSALTGALERLGAPALAASVGLVRCAIGRMIPPTTPGELDLIVEPYDRLRVDQRGFLAQPPLVPHLELVAEFDRVVQEKLFLHNLTHACLAYAGAAKGVDTIAVAMEDRDLVHGVRAAAAEIAAALAGEHGLTPGAQAVVRTDTDTHIDDLLRRFRNPVLGDTIVRVARDPARKLGPGERLIGGARLCLKHGIVPHALARHICLACRYQPPAGEPGAEAWAAVQAQGLQAQLTTIAGISPGEDLMDIVIAAGHRLAAAQTLRSSGVALRDAEVDQIEIADFGLGRFAEFGLAIVIYVNTSRCCAKELVMLPHQSCPEHRHPPVDDDSGKEETFRCRSGEVHLFLPGHKRDGAERAFALSKLPADKHECVSVFRHVHLRPGEQCTLRPNTPHWFVAGPAGAIISEFSTRSRDEADIFTDPAIRRVPEPV